eukprot:scaffold113824_cov16-Tisochrysis_lutea.AAC.1
MACACCTLSPLGLMCRPWQYAATARTMWCRAAMLAALTRLLKPAPPPPTPHPTTPPLVAALTLPLPTAPGPPMHAALVWAGGSQQAVPASGVPMCMPGAVGRMREPSSCPSPPTPACKRSSGPSWGLGPPHPRCSSFRCCCCTSIGGRCCVAMAGGMQLAVGRCVLGADGGRGGTFSFPEAIAGVRGPAAALVAVVLLLVVRSPGKGRLVCLERGACCCLAPARCSFSGVCLARCKSGEGGIARTEPPRAAVSKGFLTHLRCACCCCCRCCSAAWGFDAGGCAGAHAGGEEDAAGGPFERSEPAAT